MMTQFGNLTNLTDAEIAEINRRAAEMTEALERRKKTASFYASGINDDNINASFETFIATTDEQKKLLEAGRMMVNVQSLKALVLCGKNGTGKTFTAACCLRELGGIIRKSMEICSEYSDAGRNYAKDTQRLILQKYVAQPFLVIDEVCRTAHPAEREVVSYIVSERIEKGKKTIVIGNTTEKELGKVLDAAVISRMHKAGLVLELTGPDQRSA